MSNTVLVMTEERREELRKAGAYAEEVFYAMAEVNVGDLVEMLHAWRWEQEHGTREMRPFSDYILNRIKEGK